MSNIRYIIIALFFGGLFAGQAQVGTVRFHLKNRGIYRFIKDKNILVNVNDTLEKPLISDRKGYTGFLELPEGTYKLTFNIDGYDPRNRTVKVIKASGKTMRVRMKKA